VRRTGRRHHLPDSIGETIRAELSRLGAVGAGPVGDLADAWPELAGPAIAANAWPARVARDGTLIVHASSSVWAFELTQMEAAIRDRLGELAPPRLSFVVGPLPSPGPEAVPKPQRVVHKPRPADAQKAAQIARAITDPDLREAVARAAEAGLARQSPPGGATGPSDRLQEV
jgi:hypothetical protein